MKLLAEERLLTMNNMLQAHVCVQGCGCARWPQERGLQDLRLHAYIKEALEKSRDPEESKQRENTTGLNTQNFTCRPSKKHCQQVPYSSNGMPYVEKL